MRLTDERIRSAALFQHLADLLLLTVVGGQDGDLVGRIAEQTHVDELENDELGLRFVLVEVRHRFALADAVLVLHVHELVLERQAGVRFQVALLAYHVLQVAEIAVAPSEERAQ